MPSITVENYVKTLWVEEQSRPRKLVPMGRLAAAMGVTPGTATTMVKTLEKAGLVRYEPRGGVRLTAGGTQLALHVLRRHRLVELFLVEVLGLDWSEVHAEAEQWEHVVSDRVLERMDRLLHFPKVDPHGDPIPRPDGNLPDVDAFPLSNAPSGRPCVVSRIVDQDPDFLQFIHRSGLSPGAAVTLVKEDRMADAVRVRVGRRRSLTLGLAAAEKVLVAFAARNIRAAPGLHHGLARLMPS